MQEGELPEGAIVEEIVEVSTARSRFLAVSGIILSSSVMACASGLMFAYIPLKLLSLGFEPWVPASMMPALAFGGLIGCFATGPLLRLSGHARVFMLLYALVMISIVFIALSESPYVWLGARMIYGFAINGIFIVAQSWLHFAATDEIRGRIITLFYVGYVLALGGGSYMIGYSDLSGNTVPVFATLFVALAILPVAVTRLPQPEAPDAITVDIKAVWRISPVGLAGMLTVGGLTMTLQTFAPIYTSGLGYGTADVGLLMALMQVGLLFVQVPMGSLSDRIDRRYVLLMVSAGASTLAVFAYSFGGLIGLGALIIVFALWNGFNETLYSVSSALANDRADPKHYVMLSATQMICWSSAAFVVPLILTFAVQITDVSIFMVICGLLTLCFSVFVIHRMRVRQEVPAGEREAFQPVTAQIAYPGDYSNPDAIWDTEEEKDSGSSAGLVI